ncbi:uncharacterized protein LOC143912588 [Arctopsyche grandis]|uniref:uncharacterized protein LOC143912588 n=1 Tax=Arctopsyche grandis TaxID=121162 RepID=UPI00406D9FFA
MALNLLYLIVMLLSFTFQVTESKHEHTKSVEQRAAYKNLIMEYLTLRKIQNSIMFLCWPLTDRIDVVKTFSANNMRTSLPSGRHKKSQKDLDELFRVQSTMVGVIFDSCCYDTGSPFFQKYTYFNSSYVWLVLDCSHFRRSLEYLKTMPLLITTDLILTDTLNDSKSIDLYDVYHTGFGRGGEFNSTYVGTWKDCKECNQKWKRYFSHTKISRRYDLKGLIIRVVVLIDNQDPNLDEDAYLMDLSNPYKDSLFKVNYQMVMILKTMYNFTIKFIRANNWSDKNSKGLYQSGNLLGILADKKADIMGAGLQVASDRVEIADILYSTYPFRCGFIFRYQGDFGDVKSSFLSPFANAVWFSFVVIIVAVIIVIWCILLFENKYLTNINKTLWNFSDTILSIIGACCQMGSEVTPVTSASRLVYFIFFFTCLVMYNFYTSSIVSSLLNYRTEQFRLMDLAESPLECGSLDIGYAHYLLFEVPKNHTMNSFNVRKKTDNFYIPIEDGIRRVKHGGYAYHAEYNSLYYTIEKTFEAREICELHEIDTIETSKMAIFGMKHSQYSEMFKVGLNKATETGHLKKLHYLWIARKPVCQSNKIFTEVSLHQYYELRNINNVIMFTCWSKSENVNIVKTFSHYNIQTTLLSINSKLAYRSIENIFRIHSKIGVVYDLCCQDAKLSFLQEYTYFNSSYVWLIFNCENFNKSLFYLKSLPLNIRTDMIMIDSSNDTIDLYDIYHTGYDRNGFFNVTRIGNLSILNCDFDNEDLRMFFTQPKTLRRSNLNGLMMRAVTLTENNKNNMDTHEYLVDETHKFTDSIFKMNYQMVLILKRMYNFSITFVLANNWSDKNSKGFYKSGNLLGLIGGGKADIMAGALQLVKDRLEISDVLYLTYPFRCGFIFRYQGDFGSEVTPITSSSRITPVYPNMDYFNKKKKTTNFYFTLKEGIAKVKNGGFSYHAEYNTIYHLIENTFEATEICELKEIGTIPSSKLGILGMKYSSYSELFRVGLTKASETGHLKRLLLKWVARKPLCQASKSFTEVNIQQITPSHVVLYIGFERINYKRWYKKIYL